VLQECSELTSLRRELAARPAAPVLTAALRAAGPAMGVPLLQVMAHCYPWPAALQGQRPAWSSCPVLLERLTAPANRQALRARSAGPLRRNPLWRAVLPAVSVVLVELAGPATRGRVLGRHSRSPPMLQEQAPLWTRYPMLPERFAALLHPQAPRAQERNRRVPASLPTESVAARRQAAPLAVYREERRGRLYCPVTREQFAAQFPRASTRRLAALRCLGPPSSQEMSAQARRLVGPACCCRAQA
jgi:hypothetical protein